MAIICFVDDHILIRMQYLEDTQMQAFVIYNKGKEEYNKLRAQKPDKKLASHRFELGLLRERKVLNQLLTI
jgi:hypothetical protein